MAFFHSIERRSHEELFDKAIGTGLDEFNVAFVVSDATDGLDGGAKDASRDSGRTDAQVLFEAWTNGDLAFVSARAAIHGYQLHVHEGRLTGLIKLLLGNHRVVPVQRRLWIGNRGCAALRHTLSHWRRGLSQPMTQPQLVNPIATRP